MPINKQSVRLLVSTSPNQPTVFSSHNKLAPASLNQLRNQRTGRKPSFYYVTQSLMALSQENMSFTVYALHLFQNLFNLLRKTIMKAEMA